MRWTTHVTDSVSNRVLYFPSASTVATRVYGQLGSFVTNTVNAGGISATSLSNPQAVAVDASGGVYIADLGNSRVLFFASGSIIATRVW